MAELDFSDLIPQKTSASGGGDISFDDLIPKAAPSITNAVTDIPSEIANAASEGWQNIKALSKRGEQGPIEGLLTTGKAVLAPLQIALSPITGTARSVGGHLMTQAEHAVGSLIAPEIAAKDDLQKMYETAKGDVDLALSAAASRGRPAPTPARPPTEGQGVVSAAQRLSDVVGDVNVPRAIASDNMAVQRVGQGIRNIPVVGDAIPKATIQLTDDLGNAVRTVADQYGAGSGPNVANRVGRTIADAAEAETAAARAAAQRSDDALLADWQRNTEAAGRDIAAREETALQNARRAVGDMSPQDMGETLIARLRTGEREARANKTRLYEAAGNSDAAVSAEAVGGVRSRVAKSLEDEGRVIDGVITPVSQRMMAELERFSARSTPRSPEIPRQDAPRGAAAPAEAAPPPSLLEFIASKGGLRPDPELNAIGLAAGHRVQIPGQRGFFSAVSNRGVNLDRMREAAEEAGYLRGQNGATSTPRDLLDAIDAELRGQKRYPEGFEGSRTRRENAARSERDQSEYAGYLRGYERDLEAAGHGGLNADVRNRAVKLMADEGVDADTAVEFALRQMEQEDAATSAVRPRGQPVNVQEIEQTRKRLNAMSQGASNDADRAAARRIIREFDAWESDSFDNALFSGSQEALDTFRKARDANREWRQRFYNNRDDADRIINRIVTGEVTPQETANWLVGASQVGAKGVSSRLLTRIAEATGNDEQALQAIRGGVWNRLSQATEGATPRAPEKVAASIDEFLNGSGRDLARRLFTPEQQGIMRAYAETLRAGQAAREVVADVSRVTKPQAMEVGAGPMRELANAVLGRGGKTDEALFSAIDAYAKSGGRGDLRTLSTILRNISEQDKGDLAGSIIRNLGVSPRTGQFSPDVFVSQWQSYTPQAKTILFGNAGPHRQAIDDIMTISERLKQVGQRFGNPSGTAQNTSGAALGASAASAFGHALYGNFVPALTLLSGVTGGAVAAKILAAPAGASSASKWVRAYAALTLRPSAHTIAAYQVASRNLANTAQSLGSNATVMDFMRALQSPAMSGAQDQNQVPRPPGQ